MGVLRDRRRAQAGTTLVELLVSLVIAGLALALIVGTLSTGLLDVTLVKRNTAVQAVLEYEMEQVRASSLGGSYSDCFATESPTSPAPASAYQGTCPSTGGYTLRADAKLQSTTPSGVQLWTISVAGWPSGSAIGTSIQVYADH